MDIIVGASVVLGIFTLRSGNPSECQVLKGGQRLIQLNSEHTNYIMFLIAIIIINFPSF